MTTRVLYISLDENKNKYLQIEKYWNTSSFENAYFKIPSNAGDGYFNTGGHEAQVVYQFCSRDKPYS